MIEWVYWLYLRTKTMQQKMATPGEGGKTALGPENKPTPEKEVEISD